MRSNDELTKAPKCTFVKRLCTDHKSTKPRMSLYIKQYVFAYYVNVLEPVSCKKEVSFLWVALAVANHGRIFLDVQKVNRHVAVQ